VTDGRRLRSGRGSFYAGRAPAHGASRSSVAASATRACSTSWRACPRHAFVDPALVTRAYGDHALPTAEGQTISQPYIVARMLELPQLEPVIACSRSAPAAVPDALLAMLAERVFSVERVASLLARRRSASRALGSRNVSLRTGRHARLAGVCTL
jgi:protein-L-isoaspartate(D-aspartate) O-methyltransferase